MNIIENKLVIRNTLNDSLSIDELYEALDKYDCFKIQINHSGFSIWTELLFGLVKESKGFSFDNFCEVPIKTVNDAFAVIDGVFWVNTGDVGLLIYAFHVSDLK